MNRSPALAADGAAAILADAIELVRRKANEVRRWHGRRRTRARLEALDDRMLADIGLDRSAVMTMRLSRRGG